MFSYMHMPKVDKRSKHIVLQFESSMIVEWDPKEAAIDCNTTE